MLGYNRNLYVRFCVTEVSTEWDYVLDIQTGLLTYWLTDIPDLEAAAKNRELWCITARSEVPADETTVPGVKKR
jgi:hypothetical protein